jgi:ribosomal protein L37E
MNETSGLTSRDHRVCVRCGETAGEQRFCSACGLNLSVQQELPSRAEWEAAQVPPAQAAPDGEQGQPLHGEDSEAVCDTGSSLAPAQRVWRDFVGWYDQQSKGGRVAFLISLMLSAILVVAIAIVTTGGSGGGGSATQFATGQQVESAIDAQLSDRTSRPVTASCPDVRLVSGETVECTVVFSDGSYKTVTATLRENGHFEVGIAK